MTAALYETHQMLHILKSSAELICDLITDNTYSETDSMSKFCLIIVYRL